MFPLSPDIARLFVADRIADEHRAADHYRRVAEAERPRRRRRRPGAASVPRARSGSGADVRIVEARASYRRALLAFLRELSPRTAFGRFLTRALPEEVVDVDLMLARDPCHRAVLALHGDEIVGHAQAVGFPGRDSVELGVVVADDWQGRGIGTRLLAALLEAGPAATAGELEILILAWNRRARDMIKNRWPDAVGERDGELLHYRVHRAPSSEPRALPMLVGCQA